MLRNILIWLFAFVLVVHFLADCLHLFQAKDKHYFVVFVDLIIDATLIFGFIYLMGGVQF